LVDPAHLPVCLRAPRVAVERALQVRERLLGLAGAAVEHAERHVHRRQEIVEAERLAAVVLREAHELGPLLQLVEAEVRLPERGVGQGIARVLLE
jgi:hypothetical protein